MGIDEVQKYPSLIEAIKMEVDRNNRKGQFLLSGSSDIRMMTEVRESLAGRIKRITLRTFTIGEMAGVKPIFLERAVNADFPRKVDDIGKNGIIRLALRGDFPEAQDLSDPERRNWLGDYCESLLERDLKDLANIRRYGVMRDLFGIFAAWSGKYMEQISVCSEYGIKWETFDSYASALERLYLYDKVCHGWRMTTSVPPAAPSVSCAIPVCCLPCSSGMRTR